MPTSTSQIFLKNSKCLFSSSISKKKSAPVWDEINQGTISLMLQGLNNSFCSEEKSWKDSSLEWYMYVGHHLNSDPWKPAIIREKSRWRAIQGSRSNSLSTMTWKMPVLCDQLKWLPYLCCTERWMPLHKITHFVQDKPISGRKAKQTVQVT